MAKAYKISKNKYIIKFKDDYFVVNAYTKNIFNKLAVSKNENDFAKKMNITEARSRKILSKISKEIEKKKCFSKKIFLPTPLKVQWKITDTCNLKCKHCYLGDLKQTCLTEDKLLKITDKLIDSGVMEVTISGGEPLTVLCLPKIIAKFVDNEIMANIFTNATLLKTFLKKIINHKLFNKYITFNISVDGLQQSHDYIRGKGTFEKTMEGIIMATKLKYDVLVNCVVNRFNIVEIPDMIMLLDKIGVKKIQLSHLIIMGRSDNSLRPLRKDVSKLIEKLKNIKYKNIKILYGEQDENLTEIFYENNNMLGKENWKCCAGITRCTIDDKGDVYCCPFCKDFRLGNLLTQDISTIWNNENKFKFLKYLARNGKSSNRMCIMIN